MEAINLRKKQAEEDGNEILSQEEIHLPAIPACFEYLLGLFFASGQCMQTGQGLIPLNWQEIKAFREENALDLCIWEIELIRLMSEAYCIEYSRASATDRPCPYKPEVNDAEEEDIKSALRLKEQMKLFRKNRK